MSHRPFFSIIVPTFNRPGQLAACLSALRRLDYSRERFEVIVVDDGGAEPLPAVVAVGQELDVTLLAQPHGGPAAARNTGAARARGDVLAFTGDDCAPTADWLVVLADWLAERPEAAVGGRMVNALGDNPYSTASHLLIEYLYRHYNAVPQRARFLTPNNLAVPAGAFAAVGGFDTSFVHGAGEDREFCDRWLARGHSILYCPEAQVRHAHPLSLGSFCRQQFSYGRGSRRYHESRARRDAGRIRLESLSFYVNLVRYPLARPSQSRRVRLALLMLLSQVANTAGFLWQGRTH